jgi:hypothetical protein
MEGEGGIINLTLTLHKNLWNLHAKRKLGGLNETWSVVVRGMREMK